MAQRRKKVWRNVVVQLYGVISDMAVGMSVEVLDDIA